ncbi:hypothetical protein PO124_34675 [Bacillus licheniformis]|nr:hypothetical protein [Bacillus licheniformis]
MHSNWHASGALKKFGLEDIGNRYRSAGDIKRFKKCIVHLIISLSARKNGGYFQAVIRLGR